MSGSQSDHTPPPQHQDRQPGHVAPMEPQPCDEMRGYVGSGKLSGKVAIITGGDSGIGRAVAIAYAKEGADVALAYLDEHEDAAHTQRKVEAEGRRCLLLSGDVGDEAFTARLVMSTAQILGGVDILVNNAAEQHPQESLAAVSRQQVERTFRTNVFGMFELTRQVLPRLKAGSSIINTTSVTAYRGSAHLIDYAATKGAIVAFTRSLAQSLAGQGIRVNAVAPGPVWTPLIPASFEADKVDKFGGRQPLGNRPGQPDEIAPCYVFLASGGASYMTGQVLHPNGGEIVNG
ncbi:MAG: SDR family oxidoreductase [Thauera sp.]|nr:SDR family oxidoreductase [Thauera sp.]